MRAPVLAVLLALTGCATHWTHPAGGDWARDSYECRRDATVPASPAVIGVPLGRGIYSAVPIGGGAEVDSDLMTQCLQVRGWVQVAAPTSGPEPWVYRAPPRDTSKDCPWGQYYKTAAARCVPIGE